MLRRQNQRLVCQARLSRSTAVLCDLLLLRGPSCINLVGERVVKAENEVIEVSHGYYNIRCDPRYNTGIFETLHKLGNEF